MLENLGKTNIIFRNGNCKVQFISIIKKLEKSHSKYVLKHIFQLNYFFPPRFTYLTPDCEHTSYDILSRNEPF